MKIGIDISQIVYFGTGVGRFTKGLVDAILSFESRHEWTFYFASFRRKLDPALVRKIAQKKHSLVRLPFPQTFCSLIFNDFHRFSSPITKILPISDLDWFITSDSVEPSLPVKKATIVHDLAFKIFPETVHPRILHTQKSRLKYVACESQMIFTDSEATAKDLKTYYHIADSRITINYPGVTVSHPVSESKQKEHLQKLHINTPYVLTVGKREPRKNMQNLIYAFIKHKQKEPSNLKLVIAGPEGWGDLMTQYPDIITTGYISDLELATLYVNATCLIYPSLYEGFGLPVVEAMKYGCPVATSNTSSLFEIASGAALLFEPQEVSSIQNALYILLHDSSVRTDMIEKGKQKSTEFTWENYYNTLIAALT